MRGAYRIVDRECLRVLSALCDALRAEGLPFAIAEGMGVQALLAASRLDYLLRRTGDVDVIIAGDDASIVRALNLLAASNPSLPVVQNPAAKNARVGPLNVDWINEPGRMRGLEEAWRSSIDRARHVEVRRVDIPVREPEVLLAAKLTGHKIRPQDQLDIAGVVRSGVPLDEARLRELVTAAKPGRFEVFLAIRDELTQD